MNEITRQAPRNATSLLSLGSILGRKKTWSRAERPVYVYSFQLPDARLHLATCCIAWLWAGKHSGALELAVSSSGLSCVRFSFLCCTPAPSCACLFCCSVRQGCGRLQLGHGPPAHLDASLLVPDWCYGLRTRMIGLESDVETFGPAVLMPGLVRSRLPSVLMTRSYHYSSISFRNDTAAAPFNTST